MLATRVATVCTVFEGGSQRSCLILEAFLPIPFERHQSLEAYQSQGNPYPPFNVFKKMANSAIQINLAN